MANLAGAFGVQDAITLSTTYDAEFLDALIFAWNERQTPEEDRVAAYLKRCAEERYRLDPSLRYLDLGIDPNQPIPDYTAK